LIEAAVTNGSSSRRILNYSQKITASHFKNKIKKGKVKYVPCDDNNKIQLVSVVLEI